MLYKRLFLAINFGAEFKAHLQTLQAQILEQLGNEQGGEYASTLRATKADNLHLTLLFLGLLGAPQLASVQRVCQRVAEQTSQLVLSTEQLAYQPGLIWLQLAANPHLLAMRQAISESLVKEESFRYKTTHWAQFKAHITLFRVAGLAKAHFRWPDLQPSAKFTCQVAGFELMNSQLSARGAKYELVESYRLMDDDQ